MNICVLKESLTIGGTERGAANTTKILQKNNNVFLSLYDGSNIKYTYSGELIDFSLPPRPSLAGKVVNTFLRNQKLKKVLKEKDIEILYLFTSITNRQTRYKYKNVIKVICARDFGMIKARINEFHMALKNSDAMICNSEYIKDFYLSKYPFDKDKVFTVYNYIDTEEIIAQSKEQTERELDIFLSYHSASVVSVGRFCKEKGFEYLIESVSQARKRNDQIGLVLVGDGNYLEKYKNIIEKYDMSDHIYLTGFQKNPYKYMRKCQCFVLSSVSEGFPNVLAEAMALGLPVISTNCFSGPAEILRDDADYSAVGEHFEECDYGIISPAFDGDNCAQQIVQLSLAIDKMLSTPQLKSRYGELSVRRSLDFSEEAIGVKLENIFDELRGRRKQTH